MLRLCFRSFFFFFFTPLRAASTLKSDGIRVDQGEKGFDSCFVGGPCGGSVWGGGSVQRSARWTWSRVRVGPACRRGTSTGRRDAARRSATAAATATPTGSTRRSSASASAAPSAARTCAAWRRSAARAAAPSASTTSIGRRYSAASCATAAAAATATASPPSTNVARSASSARSCRRPATPPPPPTQVSSWFGCYFLNLGSSVGGMASKRGSARAENGRFLMIIFDRIFKSRW